MVDSTPTNLLGNDQLAQNAALNAAAPNNLALAQRLVDSNSASSGIEASGGYIAYGRQFGKGSATGIFVDQLTVREEHRDEMVITEHPVAAGSGPAPVSDHAYVRPSEITLECLWSNSGHSSTYASDIYAKLLRLRNERKLFSVSTGKRAYTNMLMAGLDVTTEEATEFALKANLHIRQVILTKVQNFKVTTDQTAQSDPTATTPPIDKGSQQVTTGNFNTARNGWGPTEIPPGDGTTSINTSGDTSIPSGGSSSANVTVESVSIVGDTSIYTNPVQVPFATSNPDVTSIRGPGQGTVDILNDHP